VFGFGWRETPELAPIYYAHHIPNVMSRARHCVRGRDEQGKLFEVDGDRGVA
jgi:hypothetical protein